MAVRILNNRAMKMYEGEHIRSLHWHIFTKLNMLHSDIFIRFPGLILTAETALNSDQGCSHAGFPTAYYGLPSLTSEI